MLGKVLLRAHCLDAESASAYVRLDHDRKRKTRPLHRAAGLVKHGGSGAYGDERRQMGPADGTEQVEQIGLGFVREAAPFEAGIGDCRQRDAPVVEH